MSTKRPIRCAIYTRKSTEEGLEQDFNSLDAQREACAAYITSQKAEGWVGVADRYDDGGYSGGTLERPSLKRLLRDIETGSVDVIVVYKIDRLSRSLMDFAKLVEVFDRKSVTFVSVTQSFNTTTSMGRLTLNVLLSFAQFEREVTGERIRDKFAASKKKGIWMGGNPPLGYDVGRRKLVINEAEAETVRLIFQRYLDLGCVRLLCADLAERKITSKKRTFTSGRQVGGKPIGRSGLYALLNNRAYIGVTAHKGASYKGEHQAIVTRVLFEAVQRQLADNLQSLSDRPRVPQDTPLAGLLFDETGTAMLPTYSVKHGNLRYGYYVSRPRLKGERSTAAITRLPAPPFESFLLGVLSRLGFGKIEPHAAIRRIDVLADGIRIQFDPAHTMEKGRREGGGRVDKDILQQIRQRLLAGETLSKAADRLVLVLPVRAKFHGGGAAIVEPTGATRRSPDPALVKALARAHSWREMLMKGEASSIDSIARGFGLDRGHAGHTLNLAFLSPAITREILRGEQPQSLRLKHLLEANIPLDWREQEKTIARLAETARRSLAWPGNSHT